MILKAIIIDDEVKVAKTLKNIIENNVQDIDIVATINESTKAPELIQKYQPDIVFIDIEMPNMNGFEVLECIKDISFEIIFVTAYDQYGIDAIKKNALDYILKPMQIKDVIQAISKARDKISSDCYKTNTTNLLQIQKEINRVKLIKIPTLAGIDFIDMNKITYIKAAGTYCEVFCNHSNTLLVTKSIKEVMGMLNPKLFFRSHRSFIINLTYIKRYIQSNKGIIILSNGEEIPLSRRKKEEFNKIINNI